MNGRGTDRALAGALWSLRSYLPRLILIGGWVPHLYREHGGFADWRSRLSGTIEVDLLVSPPLETVGQGVSEALREAGFTPSRSHAIWSCDPEVGERIEFFVPHRATAKTIGQPFPVVGQTDLAAISLPWLELLQEFTTTLVIPISPVDGETREVEVRLPTLGAYLLNKATTVLLRPDPGMDERSRKRPKDLVYIRDVMAAGDDILARVDSDIEAIVAAGRRLDVERARDGLGVLQAGSLRGLIEEAAGELAARDRIDLGRARSEIEGRLRDLTELLGEKLRSRDAEP